MSVLKATPYITIKELAEIVGISPKGVEWQIAKLKKEGRIKRMGPDKGGHWEVMKMHSTYVHLLEVHKKMRNLGRLVGECTGIVHIAQETHKIILPNSRELKYWEKVKLDG
ncbi:hypothetical protein ES708_30163 [subsurface metagenome]